MAQALLQNLRQTTTVPRPSAPLVVSCGCFGLGWASCHYGPHRALIDAEFPSYLAAGAALGYQFQRLRDQPVLSAVRAQVCWTLLLCDTA